MRGNFLYTFVLAAILFGMAAPDARAQDNDRIGTAAMEELMVPVTPRTISLGAAVTGGVADMSGVEALSSNAAAVMLNNSTSAYFSRMSYIADVGVNYFGIAQRFGSNNIALTVTNWDYGDIPLQTTENPEIDPSNTWSASTFVVGLTYAHQFTDRIAAGVTVKGLSRTLDDVSASGMALDAGMTYVVGESGLRFGVSLKNFGPAMNFSGIGLQNDISAPGPSGGYQVPGEVRDAGSELPSMLNFGASYTRDLANGFAATVLANFRSNSYDLDQYAAGVELGFQNLLYVRGGADLTSDPDLHHWGFWNVGAGLRLPLGSSQLMVDYAYRPSDVFSGVNVISAAFSL